MTSVLTAREFPDFDVHVESSARYYTDLSIACECAVHGMANADDALSRALDDRKTAPTRSIEATPARHVTAEPLTTRLLAISWGIVGAIAPAKARLESS